MELTQKNLENLARLEFSKDNLERNNYNSIIYKDNNYVYKIIEPHHLKELERNINFLIESNIPNIGNITDKIYYNGKFYGYIAEYIEESVLFRNAIFQIIDEEDRCNAIIDIHKALKFFHSNNIILGEVSLNHFLISSNNGYIIDLEYMHFLNEKDIITPSYNIKQTSNSKIITESSKYTDIVKTLIASLSLLLKMDLESLTNHNYCLNLENIYELIIIPTNNPRLIEYFKKIMNGEEIYFDDFLIENNYHKGNIIKTS